MAATYQGTRRRAFVSIDVDGKDVTDGFDPHLISVQVIETQGEEGDKCSIELDDRDGRLAIPPDQALVKVAMGWGGESLKVVFRGKVQSVESGFARRGGGRRLWIEAWGMDVNGKGRDHIRDAWGDGDAADVPLKDVLERAAKHAGYSMKIAPSMQSIARKYWSQNESFHAFGRRLAEELGGKFKVAGDVAVFFPATDSLNVDGEKMPEVEAEWGVNLISWRIKPFVGRPQAAKAELAQFDRTLGVWGEITKPIGGQVPYGRSTATAGLPAPAPNRQVGEQLAEGMGQASEYGRGTGSCIINGEPTAKAGGTIRITGARPGVDGRYSITEVEHNFSRSGGYITQCTLTNPAPDTSKYVLGEAWGWLPGQHETDASRTAAQQTQRDEASRRAQAEREVAQANP
jgi:phage protein D